MCIPTILSYFLSFFFIYFPSPNLGLTPPGTYNPNARGSDTCRGATGYGTEHQRDTQGRASVNVWSVQCQGLCRRNTGQNTDNGHTPNPRIEIKIPDPAGNRTRVAGFEGRDSIDHATSTDIPTTLHLKSEIQCMYVYLRFQGASTSQVIGARKEMMMDDYDGQMGFRDLGGLKLPDICLTGEEKPRRNLTQEICPDRGSNTGPLRDRRACCRLAHSGGPEIQFTVYSLLQLFENFREQWSRENLSYTEFEIP